MRIPTLLQKITELARQEDKATVLEIDLMMDYTRVLYADLMEWRNRVALTDSLAAPAIQQQAPATPPPQITVAAEPIAGSATQPSPYQAPVTEKIDPIQTLENNPPQQRGDIRTLIGINDKYQYISELFGNNKDAYNEVLDELNSLDDYEEALGWLQAKVVAQYNWEDESMTVQSFYGTLSQFFTAI